MDGLKNKYMEYIKSKRYALKCKRTNGLRIATYNIHYWVDVFERNAIKGIINDIKYINADIIFLQEVIFGSKYIINGSMINTENIIDKLDKLGYYTIFCNTLPTFYNGIYGNMLCIKKYYMNDIVDVLNYTFPKSKYNCMISGNAMGVRETRCFIQLKIFEYIIIGVHLDVCDEKERHDQINYILNMMNSINVMGSDKVILLGDFNTTDINQYEDETKKADILKHVFKNDDYQQLNNTIRLLYEYGFESVTERLNINVTAWSGIQTDYIFTKNIKYTSPQILYTVNSDHLPVVVDLID